MKKNITWLLLLLFLILIPLKSQAADIALSCYDTGNCNLCNALELGQKIMRAILGLAGSLALLFFVLAGFKMILSQGNASKFGEAQKMMTTAVVGIFIVLLAWTIVNFVIWALVSGQGTPGAGQIFTKPWQTIECNVPAGGGGSGGADGSGGGGGSGTPIIYTGCISSWEVGTPNPCNSTPGNFPFKITNSQQKQDASPSLIKFLNNLYSNLLSGGVLSPGEITITSVSDSNGIGYCRDSNPFPQPCEEDRVTTNCCWHTKGSCHYRKDGSHAVDIRLLGSDTKKTALENAVNFLGGYFKTEGDHYHVSYQCSGY
ncbi:MAG TPA: pilin [bacterium]|nr:pilin [bacterium]HPL95550.1 pilin [bacterium]